MKNLIIIAIYFTAYMLVTACSPESATLRAEKPLNDVRVQPKQYPKIESQKFDWVTEDGGQSQLDFNPQVDVLFVIDNSDSMKSAQENLVRNVDRFTAEIVKNKMIDYHIGVTTVWDSSERFAKAKKDSFQNGDLRFIRNSKGQQAQRRFVTKQDGRDILAATLNIGVTPYEQGGPENEETLSPLMAAIEKTGRGASNEEFFRSEAQLVVVLMTDADDASNGLSPESVAQKLIDFKGGRAEKVSVYGVLVKATDPDEKKDWALRIHPKYHPECFDMTKKNPVLNGTCKSGFGPEQIEKFIIAANSSSGTPDQIRSKYIMGITSPRFGEDLAKIGADIKVKTLAKEIFLSQRPREQGGRPMIRVFYGDQELPQKAQGGWLYDPEDNSVRLSGDIDYKYVEGARFIVKLVPLTLKQ